MVRVWPGLTCSGTLKISSDLAAECYLAAAADTAHAHLASTPAGLWSRKTYALSLAPGTARRAGLVWGRGGSFVSYTTRPGPWPSASKLSGYSDSALTASTNEFKNGVFHKCENCKNI